MSRETHHTHRRRGVATKENQKKDDRAKGQLFSKADANSVELSGYSVGRGAPQTDRSMPDRVIPTGVVEIDKSVQLPPITSNSQSRHDGNLSTSFPSNESKSISQNDNHLPPITDPNQQYYYYPWYTDWWAPHNRPPYVHLSHPYPMYAEEPSPSSHRHRGHRHRHHHHHHKHTHEQETYDPRWWYLQPQTVHTPRRWQPPSYRFITPKWYESSTNQTRIFVNSQQPNTPVRKYADCRCEVCKPSRDNSRGVTWVVNN